MKHHKVTAPHIRTEHVDVVYNEVARYRAYEAHQRERMEVITLCITAAVTIIGGGGIGFLTAFYLF